MSDWHRSDAVLLSRRWDFVAEMMSTIRCRIDISLYIGNGKLSMPFWYLLGASIPMLVRYSDRRRIDIDPVQFCDLGDILYNGALIEYEQWDWPDRFYLSKNSYLLIFTLARIFQFALYDIVLKSRLITYIHTERKQHYLCTYAWLYLKWSVRLSFELQFDIQNYLSNLTSYLIAYLTSQIIFCRHRTITWPIVNTSTIKHHQTGMDVLHMIPMFSFKSIHCKRKLWYAESWIMWGDFSKCLRGWIVSRIFRLRQYKC